MYRKSIVLTALLLILSLVFVFQETREVRRNTLDIVTHAEGVEAISISRGEESLKLRRHSGAWRVGAEEYPASESVIEEYLGILRELGEVEVISGRGNYSQYGLTGPEAYEISLEQDGTEVLSLRIGSNAAAGNAVYGRINNRPEVVLLPRRIKDRASVDPTEFREKRMASIEEEEITGATVSGEAAIYSLTRVAEPEIAEESSRLEEIDASWQIEAPEQVEPARIQNFLQELASLQAQDFLDRLPEGAPFATVTVETGDGEERFDIYPPEGNELYPVVSTTTEYVFLLPEWRARRLLLGAEAFLAPFTEEE